MRTAKSPDTSVAASALSCPDDQYRSLMRRYQAGDAQAFETLYARLAPDLAAYLEEVAPGSRPDASLIDEVFLTIHHARRSYDPRRPFEPWVTAIARHVALAHRRTWRRPVWTLVKRWES